MASKKKYTNDQVFKIMETASNKPLNPPPKPYAKQDYASTSGKRPVRDQGARSVIDMMGGLTNEEAQMVLSENAKGRIGEAFANSPTRGKGMYEKEALRNGFDFDAAKKRQVEGTMTDSDALALGVFKQKYGGDYGTKDVEETVRDGRMVVHGQYGAYNRSAAFGGNRDRTRTKQVPLTRHDSLAAMNEKAAASFAESNEIAKAVADQKRESDLLDATRTHETGLQQLENDGALAEVRARAEAGAPGREAAEKQAAKEAAGAHIIALYTQRDKMMNPSEGGATPTQLQIDAMDARIKIAQSAYDGPSLPSAVGAGGIGDMKVPNIGGYGPSGELPAAAEMPSYGSEEEALAGGARTGDVIYLKGIGKVRLK